MMRAKRLNAQNHAPKHRRNRGWRYRGEHFDKPLTVAYLVEKCKPTPMERCVIMLGTVMEKLKFYGLVDNTEPEAVTGTLELIPPESMTYTEPLCTVPAQPFLYQPVVHTNAYTLSSLMDMRAKRYGER